MTSYDQDFFVWTQETARAIEAGDFNELDRAALADEVESLGKRDRRELGSRLSVIVTHLLKSKYQPEKESRSWSDSIREQRAQIRLILKDSPSLRRQVAELLADYYEVARLNAADETGLDLNTFPEVCEWTSNQVLGCGGD